VTERGDSFHRKAGSGQPAPASPADPEPRAVRVEHPRGADDRVQALLEAVLAISRELELPMVLRQIVSTAMDLVGARYGALGVLDDRGVSLAEFIPLGLSEREYRDLAGVELPQGRGLLGRLIREPISMRVDDITAHPDSVGFPPGHPPMRTLLGVGIGMGGRTYGNLYLCDRSDGQPFDEDDESIVVALAGAAAVAVEHARLFDQVRSGAERFQRLLLPRLPELPGLSVAEIYRPSSEPGAGAGHVGGDWYDIVPLPDGSIGAVVGDVVGHDLVAAAAMACTRNMLRALLFDRCGPPSVVLSQLDRALDAIDENPVTTVCLAHIENVDGTWTLSWSSAGHLPSLLLTPGAGARYLDSLQDIPLGVDPRLPRHDHRVVLPPGATLILFTDGLVEHRSRTIDEGLAALATLATAQADEPLRTLCQVLADNHPSDGHDDLAILAIRVPDEAAQTVG